MDSFSVNKNSGEKILKCPICRKKMEKLNCGKGNKVLLDKCIKEHGIWFNEGELEQVVEMGGFDKQDKIINLLKEMFAHKLNNSRTSLRCRKNLPQQKIRFHFRARAIMTRFCFITIRSRCSLQILLPVCLISKWKTSLK